MATKNLQNDIIRRLIENHPQILLSTITTAIQESDDQDEQDELAVLRRDVKAAMGEKKKGS
jgi:hypothetical protein